MKRFYKALFIFLSPLFGDVAFSQTAPGIEWAKCFGGSYGDNANSILQTPDGGYIVTGVTTSNDFNVNGNHGSSDIWTVKINNTGTLIWEKCHGGTQSDGANEIAQTSDGGFILMGYAVSNDSDVTGNHGSYDYWVVKTDSTGNKLWQKCFGGSGHDYGTTIKQVNDGFIIGGYTFSNDSDVTTNQGMADYWVIKADTAGVLQWEKSYGGTNTDLTYSIQYVNTGGYIIAGNSDSNNGDITGNHGSKDYWIVKINNVGVIQWQKSLGGTDDDQAKCIQPTVDGGYIVVGKTLSNNGDVSGNHSGQDFWVVKLDNSGNIQWQKCYGGTYADEANSIEQTSDGGFIVAGLTWSNNYDVSGNHGGSDFWVVKLDNSGNMQWQKCLGGSTKDHAQSVHQTFDGGYIVAGYSGSLDGDVTGNHGSYDYWIVKLAPDTITGIADSPLERGKGCVVSPNPLTSYSTITFSNPAKEKFLFTLYDITGRPCLCGGSPLERGQGCVIITTGNKIILEKGSKPPGVYLFNLTNQKTGEKMNGKIVIQ